MVPRIIPASFYCRLCLSVVVAAAVAKDEETPLLLLLPLLLTSKSAVESGITRDVKSSVDVVESTITGERLIFCSMPLPILTDVDDGAHVPSEDIGGPAKPSAEALCMSKAAARESVVVPGLLLELNSAPAPPELPLLLPLRLCKPLIKFIADACKSGDRLFSLKQCSNGLFALLDAESINCCVSIPYSSVRRDPGIGVPLGVVSGDEKNGIGDVSVD